MNPPTKYQTYAISLAADIRATANNVLPRREILLSWLDDFLLRSGKKEFQIQPAEVENLTELDKFVRANQVPATARAPLDEVGLTPGPEAANDALVVTSSLV